MIDFNAQNAAKIDGKPIADVVGFDQYSTYVRGGSVTLYDGADGVHEVELTLTDREPDRTILARQFTDPKADLVVEVERRGDLPGRQPARRVHGAGRVVL